MKIRQYLPAASGSSSGSGSAALRSGESEIDPPILGRAIDHLKSDHQVKGASQELAGQSPVQPANSSDFGALTLWISVQTNWTG